MTKRLPPAANALFTRVDLLPAANQTDARTPVLVPAHQLKQKRRFGGVAAELLFALFDVPSTLSFVENDGVLVGWSCRSRSQVVAQEVIDVLDPGAHFSTDCGQ